MANKRNGNDGGKPPFIRPLEKEGTSTQLACRIPTHEKERFELAQQLLRENDEEMQLVDVVRRALADAADYVERHYQNSKPADQGTTQEVTKPSVGEH